MNSNTKIILNAIVLTDESTKLLLNTIHPKHKIVYANHMTINFGIQEYPTQLGQQFEMEVTGEVSDEFGQCVLVNPIGFNFTDTNRVPHITVSCIEGTPVSYSNTLISEEIPTYFFGNKVFKLKGIVQSLVSKWVDTPL